MKKILILISILFLVIGCCENGNLGYGYSTKTSSPEQTVNTTTTSSKNIFELANERQKSHTMKLYGSDGRSYSQCTAYKGEFDGHTWYVFYDNLASPSVVHDPLCKCHKVE